MDELIDSRRRYTTGWLIVMLNLLVICTVGGICLLSGWWLRGNDPRYYVARGSRDDAAKARDALDKLRELAQNVAADVDKHNVLVRRVNEELHSDERQDPDYVLHAVDTLIQSNEQMQKQLDTAENKLKSQAQQIEDQVAAARTDALTRLANRRVFDETMANADEAFAQHNHVTTVMMIDIDHFKLLNDSYGHQAGDEVLRGVASVLESHIPTGNLVARYGGEEFSVIFPNTEIDSVAAIIEEARRAIGEAVFTHEGMGLRVTVSSGVAQFRTGENGTSLIRRADEALYVSKEMGRDCCHFNDGMRIIPLVELLVTEQAELSDVAQEERTDAGISTPDVFVSDVKRRLADLHRGGAPLCVLFMQIDDLEAIGQRFGAENRQSMYRALTLTVKAAMREMDHAAKFEGETISLLLPGSTLQGAMPVAERLRAAASRCELSNRHECRNFTVSVGVAEAREAETEAQLIGRVRQSLEAAKTYGRDCTYVHDGMTSHLIGAGQITMMA